MMGPAVLTEALRGTCGGANAVGGTGEGVGGVEDVRLVERPVPRPRIFNMHRARSAVQKLTEESN